MAGRRRSPNTVIEEADGLHLWRSPWAKAAGLALAAVWLAIPFQVEDVWLSTLNYVAIFAIGGIGLNLLTGYTGQVSLGQAFFVAVGAYSAAYFGGQRGWPMLAWLAMAALLGGALGAAIGPIALRLRGNYLAIVTLGLLFVGEYVFSQWDDVTGGGRGTRVRASLEIGPFDFASLELFGRSFSRSQGLFWLLWLVVALVALLAKNIVRSRPGRAMQAIRDRDVAAEVVGVSLLRYKLGAFAVSSAIAAVAGGFYGAGLQQFVSPSEFGGVLGLVLSIQFIAVIIIGGMGTIFGAVLGALVVAGTPRVIQQYSANLPFLVERPGDSGIISVASFNNLIFGVLIIVFLLAEPLGLAALWERAKGYFKHWPFSY